MTWHDIPKCSMTREELLAWEQELAALLVRNEALRVHNSM